MLKVRIASQSGPGARESNEDDLRFGQRGGIAYAVLSDGAGGHKNGAFASDLVVRLVTVALQSQDILLPQTLHDMVHAAHELLLQQQQVAILRERMHATLVALWIDAGQSLALWSHVGDSRMYLLRDGDLRHVTRDDSAVRQMVDAGLITAEAARDHPKRHHLLCAMGVETSFVAHTLEKAYPLREGDAILLCTDGWWDSLAPGDIERMLAGAADPQEWLERMESVIRSAARPDQDNHSAIALWLG
jgi:PPM family protein phosphatase